MRWLKGSGQPRNSPFSKQPSARGKAQAAGAPQVVSVASELPTVEQAPQRETAARFAPAKAASAPPRLESPITRQPPSPASSAEFWLSPPPLNEPAALQPPPPQRTSLQKLFFSGEQAAQKTKLSSPKVFDALGLEAKAFAKLMVPVMQMVDTDQGGRLMPRAFQASVLSGGSGVLPVVMGPTRASGGYGKVRDGILVGSDGRSLMPVAIKEWRTEPMRPEARGADGRWHQKAPSNRLGRSRNSVMAGGLSKIRDQVLEEAQRNIELGGPGAFLGLREVGNKIYMAMAAMDVSLFDAVEAIMTLDRNNALLKNHLSGFVRGMAADVADHLAYIHNKGYAFIDVKDENLMLQLSTGQAALVDFGGVVRLDAQGQVPISKVTTLTYLSPEVAVGQPLTPAHDVWLMGTLVLETLIRRHLPLRLDKLSLTRSPHARKAHHQNLAQVQAFVELRHSMMLPPHAADQGYGRIDIKKLMSGRGSEMATLLARAAAVDPELTALILEHALHPEPERRISSQALLPRLAQLRERSTKNPQQMRDFLAVSLQVPAATSERLMEVAQFLSRPDIDAFGS